MHILFTDKDGDVVVAPVANIIVEGNHAGSGGEVTVFHHTDYTVYEITLEEFKRLTPELIRNG